VTSDQPTPDVDEDIAAADRRNGEPDATAPKDHRTGEAQAAKNREDDPPA
jgi:hypothetical protein